MYNSLRAAAVSDCWPCFYYFHRHQHTVWVIVVVVCCYRYCCYSCRRRSFKLSYRCYSILLSTLLYWGSTLHDTFSSKSVVRDWRSDCSAWQTEGNTQAISNHDRLSPSSTYHLAIDLLPYPPYSTAADDHDDPKWDTTFARQGTSRRSPSCWHPLITAARVKQADWRTGQFQPAHPGHSPGAWARV